MLKDHGAEYRPLDPETGRIEDVTSLTHIISTTSDFPDYEAAVDHYINVVRPSWVELCACRSKLANPRQFHPNPAFFFSDVIVTCADIPEGDEEAICGGVISMGGQSSGPLTKLVTHIVALTLDNEKCEVALKKNLSCKIVLPHWCVCDEKRLPLESRLNISQVRRLPQAQEKDRRRSLPAAKPANLIH